MKFAPRRTLASILTLLTAVALWFIFLSFYPTWREAAYATGWTLAGVMIFLTLYNLRKKLPYPPLLSSATWLQLHAYLGLLSIFLFVIHVGIRWPNGLFEISLAILFVLVAGSGIVGMILSRAIPRWLSARGEEILFERIPLFRRQLKEQAELLTIQSVEEVQTETLANFYRNTLAEYFGAPRHFIWHLFQSTRPARKLTGELERLDRFFNDREREIAQELRELILTKDHLDYHYAMQGLLKIWLFVHVPLTYALILCVILHVIWVHTYVRLES